MRRTLALSHEDLLARLDRIEVEGWDGLTGTELLEYVRSNMVRIQVISAGLTGPAGEQAEATGWAIAWETLRSPGLRTADWPWSVLWVAVRRAVRGEWVAGAYLTSPRTAWDLRRTTGRYWRMPPPLSFDRLVEDGYESATHLTGPAQPVLGEVVSLLVEVGWAPELAAQVVVRLADRAEPCQGTAISGWRQVAAELDLPPWKVRRVAKLLYAVARRTKQWANASCQASGAPPGEVNA
ncbi:MAG TPA: hypothetical protein VFN19_09605 [Candidatus Nanopelagicales bacterium]|nr:hypothetical protein [Candidatus Nanopelagicales bacterium]